MAEGNHLIHPTPGFSPQIGHLVSLLAFTRETTINLVRNLTVHQLDDVHDRQSNSIGALLRHMAAIEFAQQIWSFEDRDLNEAELTVWGPALKLGDAARRTISGNAASTYIDCLNQVREVTCQQLMRKDDAWLYEVIPSKSMNQYYRWFHVMEDELSHRGQIKWLMNRLPLSDEMVMHA